MAASPLGRGSAVVGHRGCPVPALLGINVIQVPEVPFWLSSLRWGSGHHRVCGAEAAMPGETSQLEMQRGCTRLPVTFFLLALLSKGKRSSKTQTAKKKKGRGSCRKTRLVSVSPADPISQQWGRGLSDWAGEWQ